jgi:hypothetical protein
MSDDPKPSVSNGSGAVIAVATALCLVLGSSLIDIGRASEALQKVDQEQAAQIQVSRRAEAQLNSLAKGTQELAEAGNANALAIVATLQQNGIRINSGGR